MTTRKILIFIGGMIVSAAIMCGGYFMWGYILTLGPRSIGYVLAGVGMLYGGYICMQIFEENK